MNVGEIRKLCEDAIADKTAQSAEDAENDPDGDAEPPDFGGNVDDAVSYGETRGEIDGAAALAREILKNL